MQSHIPHIPNTHTHIYKRESERTGSALNGDGSFGVSKSFLFAGPNRIFVYSLVAPNRFGVAAKGKVFISARSLILLLFWWWWRFALWDEPEPVFIEIYVRVV